MIRQYDYEAMNDHWKNFSELKQTAPSSWINQKQFLFSKYCKLKYTKNVVPYCNKMGFIGAKPRISQY